MENIEKTFYEIKEMLEDKADIKAEVDGFYFNKKAVDLVDNTNKSYFINSFYDLTTSDTLNMINNNNNLEEVKEELYKEYKTYYAEIWYKNFVGLLERIEL